MNNFSKNKNELTLRLLVLGLFLFVFTLVSQTIQGSKLDTKSSFTLASNYGEWINAIVNPLPFVPDFDKNTLLSSENLFQLSQNFILIHKTFSNTHEVLYRSHALLDQQLKSLRLIQSGFYIAQLNTEAISSLI